MRAVLFSCFFIALLTIPSIAVGSVMAAVPFYYFYHSKKSPSSEKKAMAEAGKNGGGPSTEFRDVRDSPIKTLEDKKRRDARR